MARSIEPGGRTPSKTCLIRGREREGRRAILGLARDKARVTSIFGCVTTGDDWQFFRLQGSEVVIDRALHFRTDVGIILAALRECIQVGRFIPAVAG